MEQEIKQKIEAALQEIRPFLNADGGDIELVAIKGNTVEVRLKGACTDCSVNQLTLRSGVEMTIKQHVPQIEKVINVALAEGDVA